MVNIANKDAYIAHFDGLISRMSLDDAVKCHVGVIENYSIVGALERKVLEQHGFRDGVHLVDLGCGGGRLANAIYNSYDIKYFGIDIVDKLISYCRDAYPSYDFEVSNDFTIPDMSNSADFVTAFSLFTHLLHEQTYTYIKDVYRVLKPGGKLILSFLEYRQDGHKALFLSSVKNASSDRPLIVFNERNSLDFFAKDLGFTITSFIDGNDRQFDFGQGEILPDGKTVSGKRAFGQSVCIMTK